MVRSGYHVVALLLGSFATPLLANDVERADDPGVEVFVPATGNVETNRVTDPYSLSLSMNSTRSQLVDLAAPTLKPAGWDSYAKPPLAAPEDISLYELHVRDFSATDPSVPEALKGTFKAFTDI